MSPLVEHLHGVPFNRLLTVMKAFRTLLYRDVELFTDISEYLASTVDVWSTKQVQQHTCDPVLSNMGQDFLNERFTKC